MQTLALVGMGSGNPGHLTGEAIVALNTAQAILIPRKSAEQEELAQLRRSICAQVLTNPDVRVLEFDLPRRDLANPDYLDGVNDWHDAVAACWMQASEGLDNVAFLVWGDPSLYDSTLRIAARLRPAPRIKVIPGITSLQVLTAAHAIPINDLGAPFVVTTGRRLRDDGWPPGADRVAVMLDGECSFRSLDPEGISIWWGAYVGMAQQSLMSGPLTEVAERIVAQRSALRMVHGWIMDIYILQRDPNITLKTTVGAGRSETS